MAKVGRMVKEGFPKAPAGKYTVKFGDFFPVNKETQVPYLLSKDGGLVIRYHTVILSGEHQGKQAPGSLNWPHDIPMFAKAFGLEPKNLPQLMPPDKAERALLELEKLLTGHTEITVNDAGWISNVKGMSVPPKSYQFRFNKITTRDDKDQPNTKEATGQWGTYRVVYGRVEVTGGPFTGALVPFSMQYPLEINAEGVPSLVYTKEDENTLNKPSERFYTFWLACGVDLKTVDTAGAADVNNILPVLEPLALKANQNFICTVGEKGWLDLDKVMPMPETEFSGTPSQTAEPIVRKKEPEPVRPPEIIEASKYADRLYAAIAEEVAGWEETKDQVAFNKEGKLTPAGGKWAKKFLGPVCDNLSITREFDKMTDEQIVVILTHLGHSDRASEVAALMQGKTSELVSDF